MTMQPDKLPVVTLANDVPGPQQGRWTYKDYAKLPADGKRYEIINGVLLMTPSPTGSHQDAVGMLFHYLLTHVKLKGLGLVRMAPFDVELAPDRVVQPDVLVILNKNFHKITESRIVGAPDLVVEVASPSTAIYDRHDKYQAYADAGVPEYWIVDPESRTVEVLALEGDTYRSLGVYRGKAILPSQVVPTLMVHVEQFFM